METTIAQVNLEIVISVKSGTYQHLTLFYYYAQLVKKQILWFPVVAVKYCSLCHNVRFFHKINSMYILLMVQWVCLCL